MRQSLDECYRVLRHGSWLLLMFMNSSKDVWNALRSAILEAGFKIEKIDMFDKQHGTFKHFVSENTAGYDLVLHCFKPVKPGSITDSIKENRSYQMDIHQFVLSKGDALPINIYLHVDREQEVDYRQLYSEWLTHSLINNSEVVDFANFKVVVQRILQGG